MLRNCKCETFLPTMDLPLSPTGPVLMITEFCSHGDLLNFLRAHAQDFMASKTNVDKAEDQVFYRNMAALNTRLRRSDGFCFSHTLPSIIIIIIIFGQQYVSLCTLSKFQSFCLSFWLNCSSPFLFSIMWLLLSCLASVQLNVFLHVSFCLILYQSLGQMAGFPSCVSLT